ncbi:MAG: LacI family DNA-binding transcriptional regulator [Rhodospirillales bacterium]|nr:LacI family DNA-binding transcriptional regulator [Rhodospirillales bacterium]
MSNKFPSIRTVAARAGVSTATVSNVLNARRSVAPELAARVRAAVAELGYIADLGASRLRSRRSHVAGLLLPDLANPFFGTLAAVLEAAARHDGYDLLIACSGDDTAQEAARLRALLTWRPAGIIIVPCEGRFAGRELAEAAGVRLVACDRIPDGPPLDLIAVDNRGAAASVVRHLLATGRRHILLAAARASIGNIAERCGAARAEAEAAGARLELLEVGVSLADSRAHLARRLAAPPLPDAVFALNNLATLGALSALDAAGLAVPQDVALVGFDDAAWMEVASPPLTAVSQPVEALARAAWARLLARIGGDTAPPLEVRLPCTLEVRDSTLAGTRQFFHEPALLSGTGAADGAGAQRKEWAG